jgi:GTP-binding protein LepA
MKLIRNFSIIAHIDHGKSTLADRFIQLCGGLEAARDGGAGARLHGSGAGARHHDQGAERHAATTARDGETLSAQHDRYAGTRRLSPTRSRARWPPARRAAGVDAAQGVEAQSVANCYTAIEQGLEVVPVLNKIDLPSADPDAVIKEIEEIIGIEAHDALRVSAKTGENVRELLESCRAHPPPKGDPTRRCRR